MRAELTTPPSGDVLSVADAKAHLRVTHAEEDGVIAALIATAVSHLDGVRGVLGKALLVQSWTVTAESWEGLVLRLGNVVSLDSVSYWPKDAEAAVTLPASAAVLRDWYGVGGGLRWLEARPELAERPDAVSAVFTAGYGAQASDVPAAIVHALKLLVGHYYRNREASTGEARLEALPLGVAALIAPHRTVGV